MTILRHFFRSPAGQGPVNWARFMRTGFFLVLIIIICLSAACSGEKKEAAAVPQISAVRTAGPVTIDGVLDEQIWQETQVVLLRDNRTGEEITDNSRQTEVRTCFDDVYLYISFVCHDTDIWGNYSERDQHLWKEEAVEVFIDTDNEPETYVEIEVSPHNILFDSYIVDPQDIDIAATKSFDLAAIQTAVSVKGSLENRKDRDQGWDVEMAIPVSELKAIEKSAAADTLCRINFYRINRDRNKDSESYAWSPTYGRFHKPSAFGILKFKK